MASIRRLVAMGRLMKVSEKFKLTRLIRFAAYRRVQTGPETIKVKTLGGVA
jgi:hypothetical protein